MLFSLKCKAKERLQAMKKNDLIYVCKRSHFLLLERRLQKSVIKIWKQGDELGIFYNSLFQGLLICGRGTNSVSIT